MAGKKKIGTNSKKEAGRERKEATAAAKKAAEDREKEKAIQTECAKGSDVRGSNRAAAAASKADEAARKKREKALLQAAEDEELPSKATVKTKPGKSSKKKKGDGGDFSLLEASLIGDADKKVKADKKRERERREREQRLKEEREKKEKETAAKNKSLMLDNTDLMIGDMDAGRSANIASSQEVNATGIDAALQSLSVSGTGAAGAGADMHPEKRVKALHKAFEERMLPEMKQQYPGLRLAQYKEKIFNLWKKSPENPLNWPRPDTNNSSKK